jgi:beta-lactamase regulating signal transducer with metallopeptidase domain
MSALVETAGTAFALSGLAALCLALLPQAPPRLRFAVAVAGLAAWLIPWGAIHVALPAATFALPLPTPWADAFAIGVQRTPQSIQPSLAAGTLLAFALTAASLLGVVLFAADCLALRRCVRRWRANSRPAEELRSLLPPELAAIPAEIRVVANSNVAAASGYFAPIIWIGDRYGGERLRLTVVHEMWHVSGRDPLWLGLLAAVRRVYWWNPLVAFLARHATLMIESVCDHRSARHFEKSRYVTELASLLLADAEAAPRLLATAHAPSLNVQRLHLLRTQLRMRTRDFLVVAALGTSAAATAMTQIVERRPPAPAPYPVSPPLIVGDDALPSTPAGAALALLLHAANAGDSELIDDLLGAYTPQELPAPLPRGAGELRVVEVLRNEPLRIEYVVENRSTGARHRGELAVDAAGTTITASQLRPAP